MLFLDKPLKLVVPCVIGRVRVRPWWATRRVRRSAVGPSVIAGKLKAMFIVSFCVSSI